MFYLLCVCGFYEECYSAAPTSGKKYQKSFSVNKLKE